MVEPLTVSTLVALLSAASLGLLGLLCLLLAPRRRHVAAFATFLVLWAAFIWCGNAATLALQDGRPDAATTWILAQVAVLIVLYLPLAYFTIVYARFQVPAWTAPLLLVPAAAGATAFLAEPRLFFRGFIPSGGSSLSDWGPLYAVFMALHIGAFLHAIVAFTGLHVAAASPVERRRTAGVLVGLVLYVAYWAGSVAVAYGGTLVGTPLAGSSGTALFLLTSAATLVAVGSSLRDVAHAPARPGRLPTALMATAAGVPLLFGGLAGAQILIVGVGTAQTAGLWRLGTAAALTYALLRYELFDLDRRLARAAAAGLALAGAVVVGAAIARAFEVVAPSAETAVLLAACTVALAGALAAARLRRGFPRVGARVPRGLDGRRSDVYEAALARAMAKTGSARGPSLAALRRELGITQGEHELLAQVIATEAGQRPARPAPRRLATGDGIAGRYHLIELADEGEEGQLFLARDETLQRRVAIKILPDGVAARPEAVRAFLRQARLMAAIEHPNVVRVYDFGQVGDRPFIVVEYAAGGSLKDRLLPEHPIEPREALRTMGQVLQGLACIHALGILHRDLKPSNVVLDSAGEAKIADFGLAIQRAPRGRPHASLPGPAGTPAYMAPEAFTGAVVSAASDVYSAGALLHHLLAGRTYLDLAGCSLAEAGRRIREDPPRTPPWPLPPGVDAVLKRALAKEPSARYADASEFGRALREVTDALEPGASTPASRPSPGPTPGGTREATAPRR